MKKVLILSLLALFVAGCANTGWQTKTTTTYMAGAVGIKAVDHSFKPPCVAGTLPGDKCKQINKVGGDVVTSYIASGDVLVMALTTTDSIKRDELMLQWPILWEQFSNLTNEMIALIQQLSAHRTGTAMPASKVKIAITPAMVQWMISILAALVQAIPDIWSAIQSGQVDESDIQVLVTKIQVAQDSVRGLFGWQLP